MVVLAHLGSARTDAELGILLDAAQQVVLDGQAALDFEVGARAQSMAQVADFRERALLAVPAQSSSPALVVPPGRTLGTSSGLLYDVLAHVYDWLGFGEVGDDVFRDLVIARIVEPTSKIDALRVLADLGATPVSYKTIDRHVRSLHAARPEMCSPRNALTIPVIAEACHCCSMTSQPCIGKPRKKTRCGGLAIARTAKSTPQIVVGLLVDRTGMPLEIGCFEGNTAETTTIVPIIGGFVRTPPTAGDADGSGR